MYPFSQENCSKFSNKNHLFHKFNNNNHEDDNNDDNDDDDDDDNNNNNNNNNNFSYYIYLSIYHNNALRFIVRYS